MVIILTLNLDYLESKKCLTIFISMGNVINLPTSGERDQVHQTGEVGGGRRSVILTCRSC